VNVRRGGVAGLSRERDHLAAPDPLAFADEERAIVRVHRRERARVFEDHQVAVAAQPMARVGDHSVAGGVHRRAFGDREIDPFVAMSPARAERRRERARHRPVEGRARPDAEDRDGRDPRPLELARSGAAADRDRGQR
jgi:hypothetical protein